MDSQELRNLSEAYLEVYQEIDEAKVEAGANDTAKKDIRSRRFVGAEKEKDYDAMGSSASNWVSASRLRAHKASRGMKKEEVDIYDVILSHLIDEGYASTEEAATAIMVNMSEEWRDSVVEGYVDWRKGSLTVPSRVKGNKRTQSPEERAGDSQFRKYADAQTTRGTQAVRGARGKKARLAAKQQEVIQKTTQNYNEKNKG